MNNINSNGCSGNTNTLTGKYRNGTYVSPNWTVTTPCPLNGGKVNGIPSNPNDNKTYFYKGINTADCIDFIVSLGVV